MTSKLDIVRASIHSLENMDDATYYSTNYYRIVSETGGPLFIEAISLIRTSTLETKFTYDESGNIINEEIVTVPPAEIPTREETLGYMKFCLINLLLVEWAKE